ncbi:MAG: ABC transporter ATP-binding protein [Firmicutes bacterium]|nr:ABC transporter ATP-binding protein [Bacillota bacterium]
MTDNTILKVSGLAVSFPSARGTLRAVRGISYDLRSGETLGIVGESGSGKSVSSFALMGLLKPGAIVEGSGIFEGSDLLTMSRRDLETIRGRDIAMIFQDPLSSLDPCFTVSRHLVETLQAHRTITKQQAENEAEDMLRSVGIRNASQVMRQYPFELSGGMRQRVMIAIALLCKPRLLIADEPTTALDVTVQDQILKLLKTLRDQSGTSMVFITHNFGIVARLCDRVIVMYGGRIMERATMRQIFESPVHPYTRALLSAIPRMDDDKSVPLPTISGQPHDPHSDDEGCPFRERCPFAFEKCAVMPEEVFIEKDHSAACWLAGKEAGLE